MDMNHRVLTAGPNGAANGIAAQNSDAAIVVANAIARGRDVWGGMGIVSFFTRTQYAFDILLLPPEANNGGFNVKCDRLPIEGMPNPVDLYQGAGLVWLERPTIFWNPGLHTKIYSDVTGTVDEGVTGFRRCRNPGEVPPGQVAIVRCTPARPRAMAATKVVITAHEITLTGRCDCGRALSETPLPFYEAQRADVAGRRASVCSKRFKSSYLMIPAPVGRMTCIDAARLDRVIGMRILCA
jgi:hypothetical protein